MRTEERLSIRVALRTRHPWLDDDGIGPRSVDAGECDRCHHEARLVTTCGPGPVMLGRRCAAELGTDAWCEGHADEAAAALRRLDALPPEADDVAWLWWVATGEVGIEASLLAGARARLALPF